LADNIVEISSITVNKDDFKDAIMGCVDDRLNAVYNFDKIVENAIKYGVDIDEQTITAQSNDWCFTFHLVTLDLIMGVGL